MVCLCCGAGARWRSTPMVSEGSRSGSGPNNRDRTGEQSRAAVNVLRRSVPAGLWTGRSERAGQSAARARRTPRTLLHFHLDPLFVLSSSRLLVFRHSLSPSLCQLQPRYTAKHLHNEDNEKTVADPGLYGRGIFYNPPPLNNCLTEGPMGPRGLWFVWSTLHRKGVLPRNIVNI